MIPKYFVVQFDDGYKLYLNSVFKSEFTQDATTCVLWPLTDLSSELMIKRYNPGHEQVNITRRWNGSVYNQMRWYYTGTEFSIVLLNRGVNIMAPLIYIVNGLYDMLPYNPYTFRPSETIIIDELDTSSYTGPIIYASDPCLDDNTEPIAPTVPIAYPPPASVSYRGVIPTAPPAPPAPPPPPPPSGNYGLITRFPPPPSRAGCRIISRPSPPPSRGIWEPVPPVTRQPNPIPVHVVTIIIADAIRRNESCPISCDDITRENAAVTSCGHVFAKTAIRTWLESPSSRNLCPVCKRTCTA